MAKLICPMCKSKDFTEISSNGTTVCICKEYDSCCRTDTKPISWFHVGEKKNDIS
ncbi:MAG: hypothetical protein J6S67_15360 [Methanobrevibacter sp.]|nr:hypothetical protein [Methanobrevibacter sp.]